MVSVLSSPALGSTGDTGASTASYHDYFEIGGAAAAAAYCNPLPSVPADEATIDAYAIQVLEQASSHTEICDAEYLGPYLTGLLRCSHKEAIDDNCGRTTSYSPKDLPDYENFLELLQEHCSLSREKAGQALTKIADAVISSAVPHSFHHHQHNNMQFHDSFSSFASASNRHHNHVASPLVGPFRSPPVSGNGINGLQLLGSVQFSAAAAEQPEFNDIDNDNHQPSSAHSNGTRAGDVVVSPVQPDNLIPVDLLGALDEEPTQRHYQHHRQLQFSATPPYSSPMQHPTTASAEDEFPPLGASAPMTKKAARASRSRQGSIDDQSSASSATKPSPRLQPQPPPLESSTSYYNSYYQEQEELSNNDMAEAVHMACDMVLSMNPDIGNDAAWHAAMMGEGDVGIAQYILNSALNAPPVCRHLLHSGCYRADCQFSHDLDGHTCVFWLRGRCGKGTSCRFSHGFSESILDELHRQQQEHMEQQEQQMQQQELQSGGGADHSLYDNSTTASWDQPSSGTTAAAASSFANIASQGYNNQTCFQATNSAGATSAAANRYLSDNADHDSNHGSATSSNNNSNAHVPSVRIPQDVWNPHERRDATAFQIVDPMERYQEVQLRHVSNGSIKPRTDVIDLHFQSTKTFATVLAHVLPEKLAAEPNGVWIVTGTGHHVGMKTHQKGGGVLENAVITWLAEHGFDFAKGRDRNGHGGALFVVR